MGLSMFSFQFEMGKKYLVFSSIKGPVYTSACTRTVMADSANSDIKKLGPTIPLK